eukprot:765314-Hanusia_phi.AAC.1
MLGGGGKGGGEEEERRRRRERGGGEEEERRRRRRGRIGRIRLMLWGCQTYTMEGEIEDVEKRGLLPRSAEKEVIRDALTEKTTMEREDDDCCDDDDDGDEAGESDYRVKIFMIQVQFLEIYNEKVISTSNTLLPKLNAIADPRSSFPREGQLEGTESRALGERKRRGEGGGEERGEERRGEEDERNF